MMRTDTKARPCIFILSIFLLIAMGNKGIVIAWELNKPPMQGGNIKTASIDYQKPLPSIKELRRRIEEKGYNFTVDETWVYKLPTDKWSKMLGVLPFAFDEGRLKKITPSLALPSYFDWRDADKVSSIKEQGECGSCWAHAAVGDLESKILINEDEYYDFSEQNLISCDFFTLFSKFTSCGGGNPFRATNFLTDYHLSFRNRAP